jgi:hypothetical protein
MNTTCYEAWSLGAGQSRTLCTVTATEEGFAVDVFHADVCVESRSFEQEADANSAAASLRFAYGAGDRASRAASAVTRETLSDILTAMSADPRAAAGCAAAR